MKFENVGKWMKEAEEDKLVFDNREPADFLDGDDEICTLKTENDESDYDDDFSGELLDEVESEDFENELDSPENEEDAIVMADESSQKNEINYKTTSDYTKAAKQAIDIINKFIADEKETARLQGYDSTEMKQVNDKINKLKNAIKELEFYKFESSQKNEATMSDIKAKLKGAKEVPIGHYKRGNEQTIVANDSKGEHRLIISDTGYARLLERLNANGRGEKVVEKVFKLNESSQQNEATDYEHDWYEYVSGNKGSFLEHLANAMKAADKNNLKKLEQAFPEATKVFCRWKSSGRTDKVAQL